MASVTFTNDAGETQVFDLGVLAAPAAPAPTVEEVDVHESDGSVVVEEPVPAA